MLALIALAKALRVSAEELLGLAPPPKSTAATEPLAALEEKRLWKKLRQVGHLPNLEEKRLWKKLRQVAHLPERDQRAVIRLINSVAASREKKSA